MFPVLIAYTVQTFNSCTSRLDVWQCLVVQTPMEKISQLANQSSNQLWGHPCVHFRETGWQPGVRSCFMHGLPTHLVQELNVGTVQCRHSISYPLMRRQTGHNAQPNARLLARFLDMDAWMTSQNNVYLIRKLRGSSICLAYFLTC